MDDAVKKFEEYVNALWERRFGGVLNAQRQLLGWLFTVHGAGIAACLGYVASKGLRTSVAIGLFVFTIGLVLLLIYGALFFYLEVYHFRKYEREVKELNSTKRPPQQFIATQTEKRNWYRLCEIIGWISGLLALVGLGALIMTVLNAPKTHTAPNESRQPASSITPTLNPILALTASPTPCPPGRPSPVYAHVHGEKDVDLTWISNPPYTEVGFEVARGELIDGSCQNYVTAFTAAPHTSRWLDNTTVENKTYCYRMRALGQGGNHSEWSYQVTSR